MPTNTAFVVVVPWNGTAEVESGDIDVSDRTTGAHPFQKSPLEVDVDGRKLTGVMYFARPVREAERPEIRRLVVAHFKRRPATDADLQG